MSGRDATVDDARGLIDAFARNGWASAVVQVGGREFAISRNSDLGAVPAPASIGTASAAASLMSVTAPHVGTFTEAVPVGQWVTQGTWVATLTVLGEAFELPAPADGQVVEHLIPAGALVEFGTEIVRIST